MPKALRLSTAQVSALEIDPANLNHPFQIIPKRVTPGKGVKVVASQIEGAGHGMIVLESVKPGELIFEIEEPMFTIIHDGKYTSMNTCDYCFAAKEEESGFHNVISQGLTFMACSGCKVAHYCSKECQINAWKQYHKHECRCLITMQEMGMHQSDDVNPVYRTTYRSLVRLLKMDQHDKISNAQRIEISACYWNQKLWQEDSDAYLEARYIAKQVSDITGTSRPEDEVLALLLTLAANEIKMSFHLLRPLGRSYKCNSPYAVKAGRCFDPFASMINHSCDPNALWHFEGRKLRIVASQILSPGEEICVSYIKYTNYNVRQQELKKGWGFICNCDVCLVGKYGINSEPVFNRVIHPLPMALQELSFSRAALDSEDIDAVEMEMAMFHLMIHLTNRRIHHALRGNRKEALRSCVRQYALAFEMKPKIDESEFLDIMYHMVHLIYGQDFEIGNGAISFLSLHLLHEKMLHAKAAFGAESSLYRFETTEYHKLMMTWEKRTGKKWIDLCEKKPLKAKFDKNLDLLQRWAGDLSGSIPEHNIKKRK